MKTKEMEAELEKFGINAFGRSRSLCATGNLCVSCGKEAKFFRDAISAKEYGISRLCQACQDSVFGG